MSRHAGKRLEHHAVQDHHEQYEHDHRGADEVSRRIGNGGAPSCSDPSRHIDRQHRERPAVEVGQLLLDARRRIGLAHLVAQERPGHRLERQGGLCARTQRPHVSRSHELAHDDHAEVLAAAAAVEDWGRGDHHQTPVGPDQSLRRLAGRKILAPGKIRGQAFESGKIQTRNRTDAGARKHHIAVEIRDHDRVHLELLQCDRRDVVAHERLARHLNVSVYVVPIPPIGRGELQAVEGHGQSVIDAPHGDLRIVALELGEARHQDLALNRDLDDDQDHEQHRKQRDHLRADVHAF